MHDDDGRRRTGECVCVCYLLSNHAARSFRCVDDDDDDGGGRAHEHTPHSQIQLLYYTTNSGISQGTGVAILPALLLRCTLCACPCNYHYILLSARLNRHCCRHMQMLLVRAHGIARPDIHHTHTHTQTQRDTHTKQRHANRADKNQYNFYAIPSAPSQSFCRELN